MKLYFFFIAVSAVVSTIIFAYMRNRQAERNDGRRQKLEERTEEIIEQLRKNDPQQTNIN